LFIDGIAPTTLDIEHQDNTAVVATDEDFTWVPTIAAPATVADFIDGPTESGDILTCPDGLIGPYCRVKYGRCITTCDADCSDCLEPYDFAVLNTDIDPLPLYVRDEVWIYRKTSDGHIWIAATRTYTWTDDSNTVTEQATGQTDLGAAPIDGCAGPWEVTLGCRIWGANAVSGTGLGGSSDYGVGYMYGAAGKLVITPVCV
jgi:hypothetical protein